MEKEIVNLGAQPTCRPTNEKYNEKRISEFKKGKWCKYHKSKIHNTSECYYEKNKQDKKTEEEKATVMVEPKIINQDIIVLGRIKEHEVKILIYSGASRNYISRDIAQRFGLKAENSLIKTMIANGTVIESNGTAEIHRW